MYIIDKNKDYYDYLKGQYGIDKTITYDRRGSVVLSEKALLNQVRSRNVWNNQSTEHFVVEIGNIQYIFRVDIKYALADKWSQMPDPVSGNYTLVKVFKEHKHYFKSETSFAPANLDPIFNWHISRKAEYPEITSFGDLRIKTELVIGNPILKNTSIASFIQPLEIWIELSNYISSKYNDKTISIANSDSDKIVNHGFNTKTSFRNPIRPDRLTT